MADSHKPDQRNLLDLITVRSVAVVLLIVGVTVSIAGSLLGGKSLLEIVDEFYANAGTELVSIALTVLVIDTLNQRRADRERAHQEAEMRRAEVRLEKQALILQMGSPDNAFAVEAARIIRAKGWLHDGTLQNVNLWSAGLRGARLRQAVLCGAYMCGADLSDAHLAGGNLSRADLRLANMSDSTLTDVDLSGADLRGARLSGADLSGATLVGAKIDETTILPDGTAWMPEADLNRFTRQQAASPFSPPPGRGSRDRVASAPSSSASRTPSDPPAGSGSHRPPTSPRPGSRARPAENDYYDSGSDEV
jgi:uncharacterized protein YjbI with pentapeptide repeats